MINPVKQSLLVISLATLSRVLFIWLLAIILVVSARDASAQQSPGENQARILVRANARVEVRTELYAPVLAVPFSEGDQFNAGDLLIQFDCARYDAEKNAAGASAHASNIEHRTKRKLFKYKAIGKDELQLAAALSAKANAELKSHQVRITQCAYHAPFTGRIATRNINKHEFPGSDKPLLTILNDTKLELQLVVPSIWLRWLEIGQKFAFEIDETGERHFGIIVRLGAEVDPVSQTIKITGKFVQDPDHSTKRVLAGMSGTAFFSGGS